MKKRTLVPLIIIIIGLCLALAGFAVGGLSETRGLWFDREGFHLSNQERGSLVKVNESYDGFKDIEISAAFLDYITLKEGKTYTVRGQNYTRYGGMNVSLVGDRLVVDAQRHIKWFNFGVGYLDRNDCWLEITYPEGTKFENVNMDVGAGRIAADNFDCDDLYINNDFGKVEVQDISCITLNIIANSGDVRLKDIDAKGSATIDNDFGNVVLAGVRADDLSVDLNAGNADIGGIRAVTVSIKNDFGRIDLDNVVADSLDLKLNSGDLSAGNVETGDLFIDSDFGLVRIDSLVLGGAGEIEQNSGDVRIGVNMNEDDLSYEIDVDAGSITIDGRKTGNSAYNRGVAGGSNLLINSDFGNVSLKFLN